MVDIKDLPLFNLTVGQFEELIAKHSLSNNSDGVPDILGKEEFCKLTGYSIDALNQMISKKDIPHYKPKNRKRIYFKRSEVIDWMLSNRIESKTEYLNRKDNEFINRKERR